AQSMRAEGGLELPSLTAAAQALAIADSTEWEAVFLNASKHARIPWGARIEPWREVEAALPDMMDRITLEGVDPAVAAHEMALRLDRLLAQDQ
ncbi:MAG: hypothetical protein ACM368_16785, partial [Gemmatimonadota bacterium]